MTEHPIIFSGEMVRAILNGLKWQTRRVMKQQPGRANRIQWPGKRRTVINIADPRVCDMSPYGQPGDQLWVRETWGITSISHPEMKQTGPLFEYEEPDCDGDQWEKYDAVVNGKMRLDSDSLMTYRATWGDAKKSIQWRPSIFMPRWASRIDLRITNIRVERVQEISEDDARVEGIEELVPARYRGEGLTPGALSFAAASIVGGMSRSTRREFLRTSLAASLGFLVGNRPHEVKANTRFLRAPTPRETFAILWDFINGKKPGRSWADNPYVWVVEFERIRP